MKWLSFAALLLIVTGASSAAAADFLVLPAAWNHDAELNAPADITDTTTPKNPAPLPLPMPAPMEPAPLPESIEPSPEYEHSTASPPVGYFTWFGGGCCERQPSCCDNVWKGYCGQRKQWCHKEPKCHACRPAPVCQPAPCGCAKPFAMHWRLPTWGGHHGCQSCQSENTCDTCNGGAAQSRWTPWYAGGWARPNLFGGWNSGGEAYQSYDMNASSGEPTPALQPGETIVPTDAVPSPIPAKDDRTAQRSSWLPTLRLPWTTGG